MAKLLMKYAVKEGREDDLYALGLALADYLDKNFEQIAWVVGHGFLGLGPGKRVMSIEYDINAAQENNVHTITIEDAFEGSRLEREIRELYKKYHFEALAAFPKSS